MASHPRSLRKSKQPNRTGRRRGRSPSARAPARSWRQPRWRGGGRALKLTDPTMNSHLQLTWMARQAINREIQEHISAPEKTTHEMHLFTLLSGLICCASAERRVSSIHNIQNKLLFQPYTDKQSWFPAPPDLGTRMSGCARPMAYSIHAWWFPHPRSTGAILLCHGNAGNLSHCRSACAQPAEIARGSRC